MMKTNCCGTLVFGRGNILDFSQLWVDLLIKTHRLLNINFKYNEFKSYWKKSTLQIKVILLGMGIVFLTNLRTHILMTGQVIQKTYLDLFIVRICQKNVDDINILDDKNYDVFTYYKISYQIRKCPKLTWESRTFYTARYILKCLSLPINFL